MFSNDGLEAVPVRAGIRSFLLTVAVTLVVALTAKTGLGQDKQNPLFFPALADSCLVVLIDLSPLLSAA